MDIHNFHFYYSRPLKRADWKNYNKIHGLQPHKINVAKAVVVYFFIYPSDKSDGNYFTIVYDGFFAITLPFTVTWFRTIFHYLKTTYQSY